MANTINILAVSGSLRARSANTAILKAMAAMAPLHVHIAQYEEIGGLPFFNPETEEASLPLVAPWRKAVHAADGVIFCTPEYAFGVPGVLKNALDLLVGSGELNGKPVAVVSASPLATGGEKALFSLENTLTALGTVKSEATLLKIPFIVKKLDTAGVLIDEETKQQLASVLNALIDAIETAKQDAAE